MANEIKNCLSCDSSFEITDADRDFYTRQKVAPPTWCPECRMIRRFAWRNERLLFRRPENLNNQEIFSGFPPGVKAKIYDLKDWNGDGWDPMSYGRDFDPTKPFLEQYLDLLYTVPWPAKSVINMVNSDYCDQAGYMKNAYLCFNGAQVENSGYLVGSWNIKDSYDLYECRGTELSYDNYMIDDSYQAFYSINSEECRDIWFSNYLVGCSNCFGCMNLRNKHYYIFNEPHTKESYQKFMDGINTGSHQVIEQYKKKAEEFWEKYPAKFTLAFRNQNSTGEHVEHSKNVHDSYCIHGGENLKYCQFLENPSSDSYDYTNWGENSSQIYESLTCGSGCSRLTGCWECWVGCSDLGYSAFCRGSSDLFGCIGLRKKQYCILNKQYSKEEYEVLREKIIEQMKTLPFKDKQGRVHNYGDFLPTDFSPFAYNETLAQDFFPLTKEEAEKKDFLWREPEKRSYQVNLKASDIPDNIKDAKDDITEKIIGCSKCSEPYRIIKPELEFLRNKKLPLPRFCPNCRYLERFRFVNPPKLRPMKCHCAGKTDDRKIYENTTSHSHGDAHCPNEFGTSFREGVDNIIYCEECYQTEVV